jgi:putative ABC transport system ATP-binding protein
MTALIEVRKLSKDYITAAGSYTALRSVDLEVQPGEFVAIMGPSGSGKSTFMNLLGCLDKPTSGDYRLAGRDVSRLSPTALADVRNRTIGFVFQGFNLLPRLTTQDNVALPLLYAGAGWAARRKGARDLLARMGLEGFEERWPNQLSGGQQQRVAIARALANRPPLILADEPTGNLDSATGEEIMTLFNALNDEGITIVLVTHEPDIASHARRLVRFRDGRIVEDVAVGQERPEPRRHGDSE